MNLSRDSLSGQNSQGRLIGARSSRALSTLFRKLKALDSKIGILDYNMRFYFDKNQILKAKEQRAKWDAQRKDIRLKRKGVLK